MKLDNRTSNLFKNIGLTTIYRALSVGVNFISVPVLIKLLGTSDYGIWITISTLLAWIVFFDFGISLSLQNRIAKSIALNQINETKSIISSTYSLVTLMMLSLFILVIIFSNFIDWSNVLNVDITRANLIHACIIIVAGSISSQMVLKLITSVLFAYQKTNIIELITFIIQSIILLVAIILNQITVYINPLLAISILYSTIPIIIWLISNIYFFKNKYNSIAPSLEYVNIKKFGNVIRNTSNFFFLQIYGLILFQTDNILVANLFNPSSVTTFSLTTKYYNLITILSSVILLPLWSAISEAYAINDMAWIKKILKKKIMIWAGLVLLGSIMFIYGESIIKLWTQKNIMIPVQLSLLIGIYTITLAYNNMFGVILNAANIFRVQIILISTIVIINIPLSYILVKKTELGLSGIVVSNLICVGIFGLFVTIQVIKILNGNARGIWSK